MIKDMCLSRVFIKKITFLKGVFFSAILSFFIIEASAQELWLTGTKTNLNDAWKFHLGGVAFANRIGQKGYPEGVDADWEIVSFPHTWNAHDPFDDEVSYVRGIGWYRKSYYIDSTYGGKSIFLKFEGANQRTELYVNGAFVGQHKGGYTGFTFDITDEIIIGAENLLAVMVDNSHDNSIAPLSVGYALYGGIYRDAWLITKKPVHFKLTHFGSSGIFITTPEVSNREATINIRSIIENQSDSEKRITVAHEILNGKGEKVLSLSGQITLPSGESVEMQALEGRIRNPELWTPEVPNVYSVVSTIVTDGILIDQVKNPLGFRWYSVDPEEGFMLNGAKYIIKGTNRHQDFEGIGCALSNDQHIKDMEWIKAMGANFVRLAHYPQDPVVLETADRLGLIVWAEVPNVNYIVPSPEMTENSSKQIKEMIFQGFNHPSVIFWGSTNEIFLWDKTAERKSSIENPVYRAEVRNFVFTMDSIIRISDPHRISTLAIHGSKDYDISGITDIPQMLSVNHYSGWYSGEFPGFGNYLDSRHNRFPNQVIFVSEYGAGADVRINTTSPERFDFSGQYQQMFHKSYLRQLRHRDYLAGSALWNQFDFSQPHTGGSIYHLNQKGLQNWDRTPKDTYYLYKANWNPEPMVYIASRDWSNRSGWKGKVCHSLLLNTQPVSVYSNMKEVELFVNNFPQGKKKPDDLMEASWDVDFYEGINTLRAVGRDGNNVVQDTLEIRFVKYDLALENGESLAINVGYNCEFEEESGIMWLPDQRYTPGHYGARDGKKMMINKDIIISGAGNREPVFNYYLEGLSGYSIDIPKGKYKVNLYFADGEVTRSGERVFDILVNELPVFRDIDLYDQLGFGKVIEETFIHEVKEAEGLSITFSAKKGHALLNGIKLTRID